MIKKAISYVDYDGEPQVEVCWFNFSKAEVLEMNMEQEDGLYAYVRRIMNSDDNKKIIETFKELILKSYGRKSIDGRKFIKNAQIREEFACSEAYSELFIELSTNAQAAAEFFAGIIPEGLDEVAEKIKTQKDISQDEVASMVDSAMNNKKANSGRIIDASLRIPSEASPQQSMDVTALVEKKVNEIMSKNTETPSDADIDSLVEQRVREALAEKEVSTPRITDGSPQRLPDVE